MLRIEADPPPPGLKTRGVAIDQAHSAVSHPCAAPSEDLGTRSFRRYQVNRDSRSRRMAQRVSLYGVSSPSSRLNSTT